MQELKHCRKIQKEGFEEKGSESYCVSLLIQKFPFDRVDLNRGLNTMR